MGSSDLQQILRSLCVGSDWKYAVFWKLKHRARIVLTLEDAYYDNDDDDNHSEDKLSKERKIDLHGGQYPHDLLGSAVAKMSYHVYSLGEGVVGQVAVSGKHHWTFAGNVDSSCSSSGVEDGWQSQFSAGIKTVLVVAAGPHGVVQLGSLNKVNEDMKLVTRIRELFFAIQDYSEGNVTNISQFSMSNSLHMPDLPAKGLDLEAFPYATKQSEKPSFVFPYPNIHPGKVVEAVKSYEEEILDLKLQNQVNGSLCEAGTRSCRGLNQKLDHNRHLVSGNPVGNNKDNNSNGFEAESFLLDCGPSYLFDPNVYSGSRMDGFDSDQTEVFHLPESSDTRFHTDAKKKLEIQSTHADAFNTHLKFFTGCELLEALGPAFLQKSNCVDQEAERTDETGTTATQMPEEISGSQLTYDSSQENLLDAVVANACHGGSGVKPIKSSSHANHSINSAGCSINQPSLTEGFMQQSSSEVCGALSSRGFSSTCPSSCTEQLEKSMEPHKSNKRRAKPGETCRPRPRDRQLIQDRIKELRELVPNGSKCSIDSLLERTIKHMLFLQNVTEHAEKLSQCAESKMHHKGNSRLASSNSEQGSSWAVEVGGHLKVCSIVVENISNHGQMLVEMLCEECCHFLEIAEAIRSLGLTILKGTTEAHGDKTWLCFVVEGQNSKVMHRMDILWSLVRIFQPKTTS